MKKFEVMAYSLEEAKEKAQDLGIIVTTNVTQSWKNAKCPISDKDFKAFAVEMLEKKRLSKYSHSKLRTTLKRVTTNRWDIRSGR